MLEATQSYTSDLQRTVESLLEARPDLKDPEKLHLFEEILNERVAACNSARGIAATQVGDRSTKAGLAAASQFTLFATTFTGGACAAMFTALMFPTAPPWVIAAVGLLGFLATKFGGPKLDRWMEAKLRGGSNLSD